jgi:uncharacterized integral membrane protein
MLGGLRRIATWSLRGILLVLLTVLALMNAEPVALQVFGQRWQVPLAVALFGAVLFGVLLAWIAILERYLAMRREMAGLRRELAVREAEPRARGGLPPLAGQATDADPDLARAMEQ